MTAGKLAWKQRFGFAERLEKGWVVRDLVAAQAGFFIDHQLLNVDRLPNSLVAALDFGDSSVREMNLPAERGCCQQQRKERHEKNLAQDAIETGGIQNTSREMKSLTVRCLRGKEAAQVFEKGGRAFTFGHREAHQGINLGRKAGVGRKHENGYGRFYATHACGHFTPIHAGH